MQNWFQKIFAPSSQESTEKKGDIPNPYATIGVSGTANFGGYITEKELNAALSGTMKYQTYSNILANTSIVAAGTRYFLNLLASASWKAEPASGTGIDDMKAALYAEKINQMLHDMDTPWHRVVRRAAMYRFYGFSIQEWTAKKNDDGDIAIKDISPRPQITIERWDLSIQGDVLGVWQRSPQTGVEIYLPRSKLVYAVDDSLSDSPEGFGLFRNVVAASKRLERYEQLEGFGFETDLRGIPVVRIPYQILQEAVNAGKLTKEAADAAIARLESFVAKHIKNPQLGLALDSITYQTTDESQTPSPTKQWDVDLLKGDGGNFEAVGVAIERVNHEIARILGVEQLLLGQTRGTQALSQDKSHNFALIVDSSLTELQETYNKDLVTHIFNLNGWDKKHKPILKTDKIQHRDIAEIGQVLRDLALAGATLSPDDPAIAQVRNQLGLSAPLTVVAETDLVIPRTTEPEPTAQ